ncbi:type VI secretion system contractile sheath large subunit [Oceanibaculum nanhaiense]|uniref:type VI secretion system contractile sheath large subunit n=1 Tax=Oceanibaculum nanhaiense TaxID=1909734 RepID=UPI003F6ED908
MTTPIQSLPADLQPAFTTGNLALAQTPDQMLTGLDMLAALIGQALLVYPPAADPGDAPAKPTPPAAIADDASAADKETYQTALKKYQTDLAAYEMHPYLAAAWASTQAPTAPTIPPEATPEEKAEAEAKYALKQDIYAEGQKFVSGLKAAIELDEPMAFTASCIDRLTGQVSDQVNQILHDPDYQALEAHWRGLSYMVMSTHTNQDLILRVLDCSYDEVKADFKKATGWDQTALFKKIYTQEYGTLGGKPYGVMIGDFAAFSAAKPDVDALERMAQIAAASHCPFVGAASPHMFGLTSFTDLNKPTSLSKIFGGLDYLDYNSLRSFTDSRYVSLVLPQVLLRSPYDAVNNPADGFEDFEETLGSGANQRSDQYFLWGNPAYYEGALITNAFYTYNWLAAIRGEQGGGLIENLPVYTFTTAAGEQAMKIPTQVMIPDRREAELNDLGFIAICNRKLTNQAVVFGGKTIHNPPKWDNSSAAGQAANASESLSATLPYMLNAARIAQYIKVMLRDTVGSFETSATLQNMVNDWLGTLVLLDDEAQQSVKARYPLRNARADVQAVPGKPGYYTATVYLQPFFQLEGVEVTISLVAELPPPAAAA